MGATYYICRPPEDSGLVSTLPTDKPLYRGILEDFVGDLAERLKGMRQAFDDEDFDQLSRLAHGLKGIGGSLGYTAFTDPSRRLEQLAKQGQLDTIEATIDELQSVADRIVVPSEKAGTADDSEKNVTSVTGA